MPYIADLHIHSRYSRATSRELCFAQLWAWGRRKGIALVGTGDCTHPGWLAEMREQLVPAGDGLYRLRPELQPAGELPPGEVRFLVTGEISTIYKADGATRKVHHLVLLPDLDAAECFAARLARLGNIASDGRPILGLDSRDLLETLLEASADALLIPAHIWTPWFSVLGSKSGFPSIDACYRDLAGHICAVETGLSSDPPMNWRVSALDRYTLVSNSDAHSPGKLGREANLLDGEPGYHALLAALRRETPDFLGTLEFFPEEGKYHFDGHRKCDFTCPPEESARLRGRCPVCGGALTLGVEYRVVELADRPRGAAPAGAPGYHSLLSLAEILAELHASGPESRKVEASYARLLAELGPELSILLHAEPDALRAAGGELLAQAIMKMRAGQVHATPGYDGEYGVIRLFTEDERAALLGQSGLFGGVDFTGPKKARAVKAAPVVEEAATPSTPAGLSPEQQRAINAPPGPLLITAGPGAGKTRVLVERIAHLVADGAAPAGILAITFSNRAAREMHERLESRLNSPPRAGLEAMSLSNEEGLGERLSSTPPCAGEGLGERFAERSDAVPGRPTVATFHKLGLQILTENPGRLELPMPPRILAEEEAAALLRDAATEDASAPATPDALERVLAAHVAEVAVDDLADALASATEIAPGYTARKRALGALDFTDLLLLPLALLAGDPALRARYRQRWTHVFVDEYQDVNVFQYLLLRLLCPADGNLCAIGDPDQAIYGFRGADVRYFLRFREDYPAAEEVSLTRNYRSARAIVSAATEVIARDSALGRRRLWSDLPGPEQIALAVLPSPAAEAEYVVQTIEALLGGISHFSVDSGRAGDGGGRNLGFSDIAVLTRAHAQGDEVQAALSRAGIPVQRAARRDVFGRADVRAVLAAMGNRPDARPMPALLSACLEVGILEDALRQPPWSVLLGYALGAATVDAFLREIQAEQDIDLYDPRAARVALMTVHAAKGLEWEAVFLVGCEDGIFPHPASPLDEERRLFYVGMTRARTHLSLSHAAARTVQGQRVPRTPSPFLADIPAHLLHVTRTKATPRNTQLSMTDLL